MVLYEMGYHHGEPTWRDLLESYGVETLEDLREALAIYDAVGWGRTEAVSLDLGAKTAEVGFSGNFECATKRGRPTPASNFVRGHLAGLFEVIFGTEVQVRETKCTAKGDRSCLFSVESRPTQVQ